MEFNYKVLKSDSKKRLDVYLAGRMPQYARNFFQTMIRQGNVKINSRVVKKCGQFVRQGDSIYVNISNRGNFRGELRPNKMKLRIIYEDQNLLVVDKPFGIVVHPGCGNYKNTLLNGLLYKFKEIGEIGKSDRLGLIHRIDKDTSGIVLVARNDYALWFFSGQFEERSVEKLYIAVVKGDIRKLFRYKKKYCISNYIARSSKNRKKMAIVDKNKGKLATTYFYLLECNSTKKFGDISVVVAMPKTGRTHQIRVHLSQLGFPIIGDKIYSRTQYKRMLLHAYGIKVRMIDGKLKRFFTNMPREFSNLLKDKKIITKVKQLIC